MEAGASGQAASIGTIDVWLDTAVWCGDTHVGTAVGLVCSALAPHLHEVVVSSEARDRSEYLAAAHDIARADRRDIVLDQSVDALHDRPLPTGTVRVEDVDQTWWTDLQLAASTPWELHPEPVHLPVVTGPELGAGDVLVRRAAVHVDHHHVGHLAGLQVDRASGRVTAAIADVGHRWHHRQVLVPAEAIEEVAETVVFVRGTKQAVAGMPSPDDGRRRDERVADQLRPAEPHDVGVEERAVDSAHAEAAHLVADQAGRLLRDHGFTDTEIREWADVYVQDEGSGDLGGFLAWIAARERASSPPPA